MHENFLIAWKIYFYRLVLDIEFSGSFSRLIFYFLLLCLPWTTLLEFTIVSVRSLLPPDFLLASSLWIMQRWASDWCSVWYSISFMNLVHRGIEVCNWGNVIFMFSTLSPLSGILITQDLGKLPPHYRVHSIFNFILSSHFSLRSSY